MLEPSILTKTLYVTSDVSYGKSVRIEAGEPGSKHIARIVNALRAVLPPSVEVELLSQQGSAAELRIVGHQLRAQWLGAGLPSEIRSTLNTESARPDLLVARRMSPGAREMLSHLRMSWVDELGSAEIALGTIVVSRTGRPSPKPPRAERWTPAVLGVAEALLSGAHATVAAIRAATGLSGGACTYALRTLTKRGLLAARAARGPASGRRLEDQRSLLDAYASEAAIRSPSFHLVVGATWRDTVAGLAELGRRWTQQGLEWAATGAAAAAVMAPLLTHVGSATVYVHVESIGGLEALAASSELRPVEGGRLTLAPFPTSSVRRLAQTIGDMRVAPWPRVYVDLQAAGVRGEEAAEHLLEVISGR